MTNFDLNIESDFKSWAKQNPKHASLLGAIIRSWLNSKARIRNDKHNWAAYSHEDWGKWTGVSKTTFWRLSKALDGIGLIRIQQSFFAGKRCAFIRPTRLAMKHYNGGQKSSPVKSISSSTAVDYVTIWQETFKKVRGVPHCVLSKPERYQLKQAVDTLPPEHVERIIKAILIGWDTIAEALEEQDIDFKVSSMPSPRLFLKHVGFCTTQALSVIASGDDLESVDQFLAEQLAD